MSLNKIEMDNLKRDLQIIRQSGIGNCDVIEALKLIELRRLSSHLEYIGSILENAPWNINHR